MRVIENRAASRAELLPAREALKETRTLVLASRFPRNLGDAAHFAAMNAANLASRPAHILQVIKAFVLSAKPLRDIYQLHGSPQLPKT
jgi:hypothetical protein